jgi:hypothetical protein
VLNARSLKICDILNIFLKKLDSCDKVIFDNLQSIESRVRDCISKLSNRCSCTI